MQQSGGRPGFAGKLLFAAAALFLLAALAVAGAVYVLRSPEARVGVLNWKLSRMKGADYSSDVADLIRDQRYEEAEKLASFVAANPEMSGQETIRDLREQIAANARKNKSPLERGLGLVTGFLSGGGDSVEALLGGLLSNVLISNKGMSESDFPRRARDDSEKIATALENANLNILSRWFPGLIRTLHISNLLSPDFESFLTANAEQSAKDGKPTEELLQAVDGTKETLLTFGLQRALGLFPHARNGEDLRQLAKYGRSFPDETYIIVTHGGIGLLYKVPDTAEGDSLFSKIARKGDPAIAAANFWLK
ncbi:MAG: hypothetical protein LBQ19_05945 [Synergistaceae bacterium]|nr:hypothetical protein [Synergistaceae bacterium]